MTSPCPGPGAPHNRPAGKYLCHTCWSQLSQGARRQLLRRGNGAITRYRSLSDQLAAGTPLSDVRIT
jgi:hypothetical protein